MPRSWCIVNFITLICWLYYYCRWNFWFCNLHSIINVVGSHCRILIWFKFIFSANCHIIRIKSKLCQMAIVLTRCGALIWLSFLKLISRNYSRPYSGLCYLNPRLNIVGSDTRVLIWFKFIFTSHGHIIWIKSKLCQMAIVLSRSRVLLLNSFLSLFLHYSSRWNHWFCQLDCFFNII